MAIEGKFESGYGWWQRYSAEKLLEGRHKYKRFNIFNKFYQIVLATLILIILFCWIFTYGYPAYADILNAIQTFAELGLMGIVSWLITVWYFVQKGYWIALGTLGPFPTDSFEPFKTYIAEYKDKSGRELQEIRTCGVVGAVLNLWGYRGGKGWGFWDCCLARRQKIDVKKFIHVDRKDHLEALDKKPKDAKDKYKEVTVKEWQEDARFDQMRRYTKDGFKLKTGQRRGALFDIPMDFSRYDFTNIKGETLMAISEHSQFRLFSPIYVADDPLPQASIVASKPSQWEIKLQDSRRELWEARKDHDKLTMMYSKLCAKMSISVPKELSIRYEED